MKKIFTTVALVASLIGSPALAANYNSSMNQAKDGYTWEQPQFSRTKVEVTIVFFPNRQALRDEARAQHILMDGDSKSFARVNAVDSEHNRCTLYLISPESIYEPEIYGHELMHCFFGNWHDGFGRNSPVKR